MRLPRKRKVATRIPGVTDISFKTGSAFVACAADIPERQRSKLWIDDVDNVGIFNICITITCEV